MVEHTQDAEKNLDVLPYSGKVSGFCLCICRKKGYDK